MLYWICFIVGAGVGSFVVTCEDEAIGVLGSVVLFIGAIVTALYLLLKGLMSVV